MLKVLFLNLIFMFFICTISYSQEINVQEEVLKSIGYKYSEIIGQCSSTLVDEIELRLKAEKENIKLKNKLDKLDPYWRERQ